MKNDNWALQRVFARARKTLVIGVTLFSGLGVNVSGAGTNLWSSVGPEGGRVDQIEYHRTDPSTVYLVDAAGFHRSTNGGVDWQLIKGDFFNAPSAIAVDPANSSRLFIAVQGEGVFTSVDAGASLQKLAQLPSGANSVYTIVMGTNGVLYIGSGRRVFRSANAGVDWSERTTIPSNTPGGAIFDLWIDPSNNDVLFAKTDSGLFRTTDGAANWSPLNSPSALQSTAGFAFDPSDSQHIFAATADGLYVSSNGGTNWVYGNLPYSLAAVAVRDGMWVASTIFGRLYASVNAGGSWTPIDTGLHAGEHPRIALHPADSSQLIVGGLSGLASTSNGGTTWTDRNSGYVASFVSSLASSVGSGRVYIGAQSGGVHFVPNGTGTAQPVDNDALRTLALEPYRQGVRALHVQPGTSDTILASMYMNGVMRSTDGGIHWTLIPYAAFGTHITAFASSSANPSVIYASGANAVLKSIDGGQTWLPSGSGLPTSDSIALAAGASDASLIYAGTDFGVNAGSGVFRSDNAGLTWVPANAGMANKAVHAIAVHPTDSRIVYACVSDGLMKSTDAGASWSMLNWWLPGNLCVTVAIDPKRPSTIYAGNIRISRSIDAGATWEVLRSDQTHPLITGHRLALDPNRSHIVYAATDSRGAYSISIEPDLQLAVTAPPSPLPLNSTASYSLTMTNRGPFHATDVSLTIALPTGASAVTASVPGGTCTVAAAVVTCIRPELRVGDSAVATLQLTPTSTATASLTASVGAREPDALPNDNSIDLDATPMLQADLSISATGPATAAVGASLSYSIMARNNGPSPASNITVTYQIAPGLSFGAVTTTAGTCTQASNLVTCTIPDLSASGSATIAVTATAASAASYSSTATITGLGDANPSNNTSSLSTVVSAPGSSKGGGGSSSVLELLAAMLVTAIRGLRKSQRGSRC